MQPIRRASPDSDAPEFETYDDAVEQASRLAHIAHVPYTVSLRLVDTKLGFVVMTTERFASLRERGLAHSMAPVASVLAGGQLNQYHPKQFDYRRKGSKCVKNAETKT